MRCPKCGYISFDHLEQCVKCKKNIKAVSDSLHGTVFNVAAPAFLNFNRNRAEETDTDEFTVDAEIGEEDFVDDDLEVLVDDGATDDEQPEVSREEPVTAGKQAAVAAEEEDGEIEIDLSQFEDAEDFQGAGATVEKPKKADELSLSLELPEELADLSDLAPPGRAAGAPRVPVEAQAVPAGGDMEIGGLDFDLGLNGLDADVPSGGAPPKETVLALNDIDFSEPVTRKGGAKAASKNVGGANMDEDLNFDLDLGGLSLHKDL